MSHDSVQHHPGDDMLQALAAGTLPAGIAVVLASHMEACPACRARLAELEALGGALLEALPPMPLEPEALARTLVAIDTGTDRPEPMRRPAPQAPSLPPGAQWPQALSGARATPWRWLGPGMRWSRVSLPQDPAANVFLLRIAAGRFLPAHTHSRLEVTQVLWGSFDDGRARFSAGDFDAADGDVHHQPVVCPEGECICLAAVDGRVVFDGLVARTLGALVGM